MGVLEDHAGQLQGRGILGELLLGQVEGVARLMVAARYLRQFTGRREGGRMRKGKGSGDPFPGASRFIAVQRRDGLTWQWHLSQRSWSLSFCLNQSLPVWVPEVVELKPKARKRVVCCLGAMRKYFGPALPGLYKE